MLHELDREVLALDQTLLGMISHGGPANSGWTDTFHRRSCLYQARHASMCSGWVLLLAAVLVSSLGSAGGQRDAGDVAGAASQLGSRGTVYRPSRPEQMERLRQRATPIVEELIMNPTDVQVCAVPRPRNPCPFS